MPRNFVNGFRVRLIARAALHRHQQVPMMPTQSESSRKSPQPSQATASPELRRFHRKVGLSRWALYLERLWPRFWPAISVAAAFLLASIAGVWAMVSEAAHITLLAGFAIAALGAFVFAFRQPFPTRDEALRRLEGNGEITHRPASAFEDELTGVPEDGPTAALWQAHKARLQAQLDKLEVETPYPDTARRDPWALRAVLMIAVVAGLMLVGESTYDRLQSAFRFQSLSPAAGARLDAWVTPPHYTAQPPILLADGSSKAASGAKPAASAPGTAAAAPAAIKVPDKSVVIVRIGGASDAELRLVLQDAAGETLAEVAGRAPPSEGDGEKATIIEVKRELSPGVARARLMSGETELAAWRFNVVPDKAPTIAMTKDLEKTRRGAMKLFYRVEDDYGVASRRGRTRADAVGTRRPKNELGA